MKHEIKKQKTAADNTGGKSSITPREIGKEKDICLECIRCTYSYALSYTLIYIKCVHKINILYVHYTAYNVYIIIIHICMCNKPFNFI